MFEKNPKLLSKGKVTSFKTIPLSKSGYKGKKFDVPGAKAIVGILKPKYRKPVKRGGKPRRWAIQSILIPKK